MADNNSTIHFFSNGISQDNMPLEFTNPFDYVPHPLCDIAFREVRNFLCGNDSYWSEVNEGKMIGVLVVRKEARLGFLAAFSGTLDGRSNVDYFVPPVFDFLAPDSYFRSEESKIVAVNKEIERLENSAELLHGIDVLKSDRCRLENEYLQLVSQNKEAKAKRDEKRLNGVSKDEEMSLIRESQFQKAELRRCRQNMQKRIGKIEQEIEGLLEPISILKKKRKHMSELLQDWLFRNFSFLNAKGEERSLYDIFIRDASRIPPSGSGECCAPRLLQYAYKTGLEPICMAEYWVGKSPKAEVRFDGQAYPACKTKCEPILNFMLQGLKIQSLSRSQSEYSINTLYEDEWIIAVNKPSGMLSVPGKNGTKSVIELLSHSKGIPLFSVHRLDMGTSGILVFAKNAETQKYFHSLFAGREVEKRYTALLDGILPTSEGVVDLPLAADYEYRPSQKVDYVKGKKSLTYYRVMSVSGNRTRVLFFPKTGRTHQLRVHSAHKDGLGIPIVGDSLYGKADKRLMLHASYISFVHPFTNLKVEIDCPSDF